MYLVMTVFLPLNTLLTFARKLLNIFYSFVYILYLHNIYNVCLLLVVKVSKNVFNLILI